MKKVCFVIVYQPIEHKTSGAYRDLPYKMTQVLHNWQDYYHLTEPCDANGRPQWEQCIIFADRHRVVNTGFRRVHMGQKNDIVLNQNTNMQQTEIALFTEAYELVRAQEYGEEMILHVIADYEGALDAAYDTGLMERMLHEEDFISSYSKLYIDFIVRKPSGECQNDIFYQERMEEFQQKWASRGQKCEGAKWWMV
ncbi:MAG: hypothetical protein IKV59_03015 [Lachnospiraceae bacterium]|nr:hypothetical protein [Lachnospiraceae bacterium]